MIFDYFKGTNIVPLEPRRMEQVFPAVNEVDAYWTALKGAGALPARSDIDPRGIEGALSQAFILERIAPQVARFRLAGMHLTELMGMEVRGMPLTSLFLPDSRAEIGAALERAFSAPSRVTLILTGERGVGRGPLDARMILLPLVDDRGMVTRLLGALQAKGSIGRQPRRFAILEARYSDIIGHRAPPVADEPAARQPAAGFAEARAAYQATPRPTRPALRLIKGGEAEAE